MCYGDSLEEGSLKPTQAISGDGQSHQRGILRFRHLSVKNGVVLHFIQLVQGGHRMSLGNASHSALSRVPSLPRKPGTGTIAPVPENVGK